MFLVLDPFSNLEEIHLSLLFLLCPYPCLCLFNPLV